jgi:hypothetical protein
VEVDDGGESRKTKQSRRWVEDLRAFNNVKLKTSASEQQQKHLEPKTVPTPATSMVKLLCMLNDSPSASTQREAWPAE